MWTADNSASVMETSLMGADDRGLLGTDGRGRLIELVKLHEAAISEKKLALGSEQWNSGSNTDK